MINIIYIYMHIPDSCDKNIDKNKSTATKFR